MVSLGVLLDIYCYACILYSLVISSGVGMRGGVLCEIRLVKVVYVGFPFCGGFSP